MIILALDTALQACSVALVQDGQILRERVELTGRGHAERLAPLVQEIIAEARTALSDVDRIAVTTGPGAFTGLRVGLAFGRGLALALARHCIGVSTLQVLAQGPALGASGSSPGADDRVMSAINVAGSLFVGAWSGPKEILAPRRVMGPKDFEALPDGPWTVTGPGAEALRDVLPARFVVAGSLDQPYPSARTLALIAATADPHLYPPKPLYLRGSDAKLPGGIIPDEAV
jgi:tRNA threonylcarbamoyladenosine biosynthesis protein TsaB